MNFFNLAVYFTFLIKITFVVLAIYHLLLEAKNRKHKSAENEKNIHKIEYFKNRFELFFKFLMSCLLIYVFYPRRTIPIQQSLEFKILCFLFGIILLISAKWEIILHDSIYLKHFKESRKIISN